MFKNYGCGPESHLGLCSKEVTPENPGRAQALMNLGNPLLSFAVRGGDKTLHPKLLWGLI